MKVNNRVSKLNMPFAANVLSQLQVQSKVQVPVTSEKVSSSDLFQKNNLTTSPLQLQNNTSAIQLSGIYSPKQLLLAYSNPAYVNFLVESNPRVKEILNSNNIELSISPENLSKITNTHLTTTTAYALQIANRMGVSAYDKKMLEKACIFHDFGKLLIPKEIVNKPAVLNDDEKKIMDLHAELGYELLSSTGIEKRVLDLVKNHHMPQTNNADILGQILSVADIYSALREERSYKKPLSDKEALALLDQKALDGEVSTEVVDALRASLLSANVA